MSIIIDNAVNQNINLKSIDYFSFVGLDGSPVPHVNVILSALGQSRYTFIFGTF